MCEGQKVCMGADGTCVGLEQIGLSVRLEPDFALQDPMDYLEALQETVRAVMKQSGADPSAVIGMGVDFTSSTVLPVYADGTPLSAAEKYRQEPHAYVKLWKHHGGAAQADAIGEKAEGQAWLKRYGGKVSSEWMMPKILETLQKREEVYQEADAFVEAGDWIVWLLTGSRVRSLCMAGYKAFWSREEGYPSNDFWKSIDPRLDGIVETKLSGEILPTGSFAGNLTKEWAQKLGLTGNTAVATAVIDAHAALPSLGLTEPGTLLMIMGTSTCHILMDEEEHPVPGISGVVRDGILEGYYAYEAGQTAVGDLFDWFVKNAVPRSYYDACEAAHMSIHKYLREKAKLLPPGANGLMALDWWNGNRSILSDAGLSGVLVGMTLATKPEEIYRALLEATAYGAKVILDAYEENGVEIRKIYAAGGIPARDELIMQIYADVLNREIYVSSRPQSPALGSAVYASAACGYFESVQEAAKHLAPEDVICYRPIPEQVKKYEKLFAIYKEFHDYFGVEHRSIMKRLKEA